MKLSRLYRFMIYFLAGFGLLFGVVSFLVSHAFGTFLWSNVAIGFATGLIGGAFLMLFKLPSMIKTEIRQLYVALLEQQLDAVMQRCSDQGVTLDVSPLIGEVFAAARSQLKATRFVTIDLDEELGSAG